MSTFLGKTSVVVKIMTTMTLSYKVVSSDDFNNYYVFMTQNVSSQHFNKL